jgi:hypothetical protein
MAETTEPNTISAAPWSRLAKRTATIILLLTILLIPLWFLWNHIADQRLQSAINQITARHELLFPADFAPPPLPDSQNAAKYFMSAAAAIDQYNWSPRSSNFNFPNYPPFGVQWEQMADAAVKSNLMPLILARQARQFDRAVWNPLPPSPLFMNLQLPYLNDQRSLANLLGDAAQLAHQRGDDAEAIERMRDILHQADSLDDNNFTLINRLVSIGIQSLATSELQLIAADHLAIENVQFPNALPTVHPIIPVRRQVIVDLIHQLLDEKISQTAEHRAILGERMLSLDAILWLADQAPLLRPMFKLETARHLAVVDIELRAISQPNWPKTLAICATAPPPLTPKWPAKPGPAAPRFSHITSAAFETSMDRFFLTQWRVISARRAVSVTLALQLYRADHNHWPENLDQLVPTYLPAVPTDPFIASPAPIGYMLNKQTLNGIERPLLYFDTLSYPTTTTTPPTTPCFAWQNSGNREWRDVTLWKSPPVTAPSPGS